MDPAYTWSGWDTGEDVSPPEPGKEWLTIYEDGEEMAVIVLRTDASIFEGDPEALASARQIREERAALIVNSLNAVAQQPPSGFFIAWVETNEEPLPLRGPFPSYDAAIEAYREELVEAGADLGDDETGHQLYLTDDAVRIARLV